MKSITALSAVSIIVALLATQPAAASRRSRGKSPAPRSAVVVKRSKAKPTDKRRAAKRLQKYFAKRSRAIENGKQVRSWAEMPAGARLNLGVLGTLSLGFGKAWVHRNGTTRQYWLPSISFGAAGGGATVVKEKQFFLGKPGSRRNPVARVNWGKSLGLGLVFGLHGRSGSGTHGRRYSSSGAGVGAGVQVGRELTLILPIPASRASASESLSLARYGLKQASAQLKRPDPDLKLLGQITRQLEASLREKDWRLNNAQFKVNIPAKDVIPVLR